MSKQTLTQTHRTFPECALIVVAGGQGKRFGGCKQLSLLKGVPLLVWTIRAFQDCLFSERVIVLPAAWLEDGTWEQLSSEHQIPDGFCTVPGGAERADSVLAGLRTLGASSRLVAVHDGARPFPPLDAAGECCRLLHDFIDLGGAIVAAPVSDTIKLIEGGTGVSPVKSVGLPGVFRRSQPAGGAAGSGRDANAGEASLPPSLVERTIDRRTLLRAETPQMGRTDLLITAYANRTGDPPSDEAQALERAGHRVACVVHHGLNLKVTLPRDALLAEVLLDEA